MKQLIRHDPNIKLSMKSAVKETVEIEKLKHNSIQSVKTLLLQKGHMIGEELIYTRLLQGHNYYLRLKNYYDCCCTSNQGMLM